MYPGFTLIKYGRICRHGNDCHEEEVYTQRSLKIGGAARLQSHMGKYLVLLGGRKWERAEFGTEPLLKFSPGMGDIGKYTEKVWDWIVLIILAG